MEPLDSYYDPLDSKEYEECSHCLEKYPDGGFHMCCDTQDNELSDWHCLNCEALMSEIKSELEDSMYVIQRNDGAFVAPSGSRSSYVRNLQDARTFSTKESAERELCPENERIASVDDVMRFN
jgi:hypothetical protein